ncbi:Major sperm protein (MSP) domain [Dillenia turbinata]|uniref:Major sperm protein (MSP) domain n=1 Tax=Dillenia turbinata TaxID=194707 RepID=A0AAN8UPE5_9MAGN
MPRRLDVLSRLTNMELLDMQPRELKFVCEYLELKKQSSCSVRLVNNSHQYVAFKVKTTSPKKYCVRPNTGVVIPKSDIEFIVTMQAQRSAPPDLMCKDKFLIQSMVVPVGTTDDDITSSMFSKDDGKYIEERKLKVVLTSPPHSPVLSPMNGMLKQIPAYSEPILKDQKLNRIKIPVYNEPTQKDQVLNRIEIPAKEHSVDKSEKQFEVENDEELKPSTYEDLKQIKRTNTVKLVEHREIVKRVEDDEDDEQTDEKQATALENVKHMEVEENTNVMNNSEDEKINSLENENVNVLENAKLVEDIEEMKSKLHTLESKLSEAEVIIRKLTEEKRFTIKEKENLHQQLAFIRKTGNMRKPQIQTANGSVVGILVVIVMNVASSVF